MRKKWLLILITMVVWGLYIGSYLTLSRRGMAEAREYRAPGFWFFFPENTDRWRFWNFGLYRFYYPLIYLDIKFGAGMHFASEPLWGLGPARKKDE
jgi:hypothetical protein